MFQIVEDVGVGKEKTSSFSYGNVSVRLDPKVLYNNYIELKYIDFILMYAVDKENRGNSNIIKGAKKKIGSTLAYRTYRKDIGIISYC